MTEPTVQHATIVLHRNYNAVPARVFAALRIQRSGRYGTCLASIGKSPNTSRTSASAAANEAASARRVSQSISAGDAIWTSCRTPASSPRARCIIKVQITLVASPKFEPIPQFLGTDDYGGFAPPLPSSPESNASKKGRWRPKASLTS